jgi:hypothetical protein
MMMYDVTYQLNGDERVDQVDATDAAGAAGIVRAAHANASDRFELILVHLMEEDDPAAASIEGEESVAGA